MILEGHPEAVADRAIKVLEACQVEEEDFFCHVTHKTWDVILHDIRKAHENDSESAPDTTPADELIREAQKAMQSPGDRVQQFTEIFCKAFRLKYSPGFSPHEKLPSRRQLLSLGIEPRQGR